MFAEILNGILLQHNLKHGVNLDDETEILKRPNMRIGVIPAGRYWKPTISYFTHCVM